MGIKLGNIFRAVAPIVATVYGGPVIGGLVAQATQRQPRPAAPIAPSFAPTRYDFPEDMPAGGGASGPAAVAVGAAAMLSPIVRNAIIKLAQTLGSSGRSLVGFGRRTWSAITAWVQRNPGTSAIGMLTGLGLTVEEAAHFLAWGATTRRRRRGRGISARDLRITRRTTRKLVSMTQTLRELCGAPGIRRRSVRRLPAHQHLIQAR